MALPWVRLDSNIASHDKMLHLLSDPSNKRWQAAASYMFALAWAGGTATDGLVPAAALPFVHGTPVTARLLMKYGLWDEAPTGWQIRNYDQRQQLAVLTEMKQAAATTRGRLMACKRWHGPDCECWRKPDGILAA